MEGLIFTICSNMANKKVIKTLKSLQIGMEPLQMLLIPP